MKYKFEDFYGSGRLVAENKSYIEVPANGILVDINGFVGKLYSLQDRSSHCGGHGMGSEKSCQAVVSPDDMRIAVLQPSWSGPYDIEVLE